jgi:Ser/Thr protein kinase RdoA (MazF antagonist)
MAEAVVDSVLTAARPSFTEDEAAALAGDLFGVDGAAVEVDSERDQTFLIDGQRPAVLKISNAVESTDQLDMEAQAAQRVASLDPSLPVALPWPVPGGAEAFRAPIQRGGRTHWARMYDRLPGRASVRGYTLSHAAIRDWGTMAARIGRMPGMILPMPLSPRPAPPAPSARSAAARVVSVRKDSSPPPGW